MYGSFNQFGGLALSMRLFLAAVVSVTVMVADARFFGSEERGMP